MTKRVCVKIVKWNLMRMNRVQWELVCACQSDIQVWAESLSGPHVRSRNKLKNLHILTDYNPLPQLITKKKLLSCWQPWNKHCNDFSCLEKIKAVHQNHNVTMPSIIKPHTRALRSMHYCLLNSSMAHGEQQWLNGRMMCSLISAGLWYHLSCDWEDEVNVSGHSWERKGDHRHKIPDKIWL